MNNHHHHHHEPNQDPSSSSSSSSSFPSSTSNADGVYRLVGTFVDSNDNEDEVRIADCDENNSGGSKCADTDDTTINDTSNECDIEDIIRYGGERNVDTDCDRTELITPEAGGSHSDNNDNNNDDYTDNDTNLGSNDYNGEYWFPSLFGSR